MRKVSHCLFTLNKIGSCYMFRVIQRAKRGDICWSKALEGNRGRIQNINCSRYKEKGVSILIRN